MRWERIRFIRGKTSRQNGMQGMMPELLGVLPCCRAPGRFRSSDGKWHMPWASKRSLSLPRLALATPSRGVEPMSAECRFSCPHCHIHISLFLGRLLPSNFLAMFTTRLSDPLRGRRRVYGNRVSCHRPSNQILPCMQHSNHDAPSTPVSCSLVII